MSISIVIPSKNEAAGLALIVPQLVSLYPEAEIIVVDDGSSDETANIASSLGARVISHPHSQGNGAAIKTGARHASGDILVFMDADGQHQPADVQRLLDEIAKGCDMVVGARDGKSQAGVHRSLANRFYNWFAGYMTGQKVADLTSGFRAVRAPLFRKFLYLLPNGFSYPTTSTMCFFRSGYRVSYIPIHAPKRIGKSHLRIFRDGLRFLLIIFKVGTLYSPMKLFLPVALAFFLTGLSYYGYTFYDTGRFTNMSALLLSNSVLIFLIGLISEQITMLIYKSQDGE